MKFTYNRKRNVWVSDCGKYTVWIQSRIKHEDAWWAAAYMDEMPWLTDEDTKPEAIKTCKKHAAWLLACPYGGGCAKAQPTNPCAACVARSKEMERARRWKR